MAERERAGEVFIMLIYMFGTSLFGYYKNGFQLESKRGNLRIWRACGPKIHQLYSPKLYKKKLVFVLLCATSLAVAFDSSHHVFYSFSFASLRDWTMYWKLSPCM